MIAKSVLFIVIAATCCLATVLRVPSEYATITQAINTSVDGDTVLVAPGTYPESIDFTRKDIIVASNYILAMDTSMVSQTIINGDSNRSVVSLGCRDKQKNPELIGFTLRNGIGGISCSGYATIRHVKCIDNYTGMSLSDALSTIEFVEIKNNKICGISMSNSSPLLKDVIVCRTQNDVGIRCTYNCEPVLDNVVIKENVGMGISFSSGCRAQLRHVDICDNRGHGISAYDGTLFLENVRIHRNSDAYGGGLFIGANATLHFSNENFCSIYGNMAYEKGQDIYAQGDFIHAIVLDTFTVAQPTDWYAYPHDKFQFDIQNAKIRQVAGDVYVSPAGDDANTGESAGSPIKTIRRAFETIIVSPDQSATIHLSDGAYSASETGEIFPINFISNINIIGQSASTCILDAEDSTLVIYMHDVENIGIENVTITRGNSHGDGGGLFLYNSKAFLSNLIVSNNTGQGAGGLYSFNSGGLTISNSLFYQNKALSIDGFGGAISSNSDTLELDNVLIHDNYAIEGGGLYLRPDRVHMKNVTIKQNRAKNHGGGLIISWQAPIFNAANRCNIYANSALWGNDIYIDENGRSPGSFDPPHVHVVLDTFSVMEPTLYYAYPRQFFTFDILNAKVDQLCSDVYVSADGDDVNSGTSQESPFRSLTKALSVVICDSANPRTIYAGNGTYSRESTGEIFPLVFPSFLTLSGESREGVILDGMGNAQLIFMNECQGSRIKNITLYNGYAAEGGGLYCRFSNPILTNILFRENSATSGGGMFCRADSGAIFSNIVFKNNSAKCGGGLYCLASQSHFDALQFDSNIAEEQGGGLYSDRSKSEWTNSLYIQNSAVHGAGLYSSLSDQIYINNTFSLNSARLHGGAIYLSDTRDMLLNSIVYYNTPDEIYQANSSAVPRDTSYVSHCNIRGDSSGIKYWSGKSLVWLDGNFDAPPFFTDTAALDFRLGENSACIAAGKGEFQIHGREIIAPDHDLIFNERPRPLGSRIDLGAFENELGSPSSFVAGEKSLPKVFTVYPNYPNPFNHSTVITYYLPAAGKVELDIYNIRGEHILSLIKQREEAGFHSCAWNGDNKLGDRISTGLYFYQIKYDGVNGSERIVRKMIVAN